MMFTGFSVPVRVRGRLNAPPPQPERPVHAEQRVADALLVEVSVQKLVLQRAQLRGVGPRSHRRARVAEPVRRADGHRQIHGGQHAQNTRAVACRLSTIATLDQRRRVAMCLRALYSAHPLHSICQPENKHGQSLRINIRDMPSCAKDDHICAVYKQMC